MSTPTCRKFLPVNRHTLRSHRAIEYCDGRPDSTGAVCPQCQNAICLDCLFGLLKWFKLPEENDVEGAAIGCYCPFCREVLEVAGDWNASQLGVLGALMKITNNSTLRLQSANSRPVVIEITINAQSREMSMTANEYSNLLAIE
jgi:hypothetical protein